MNNQENKENNKENSTDNNAPGKQRAETRVSDTLRGQESQVASVSTPSRECLAIREDLKASVDGQLGWWRQKAVTRHIARCIKCREEREAMREFSERLRQNEFQQNGFQQNGFQLENPEQKSGREKVRRGGVENADVLDPALRARILAAVPMMPPSPSGRASISRSRRLPLYLVGAAASSILLAIVLFPIFSTSRERARNYPASPAALEGQTTASAMPQPAGQANDARGASDFDKSASTGVAYRKLSNGYEVNSKAPLIGYVDRAAPNSAPGAAANRSASVVSPAKQSAGAVASSRAVEDSAQPEGKTSKKRRTADDGAAVSIVVANVEQGVASIEQTVRQAGGSIVLSALTTQSDKTEFARLNVKIPAIQRAVFLNQVAQYAANKDRSSVPGKSAHSSVPALALVPASPSAYKSKAPEMVTITIQLTGQTRR